MRQKEIGERKRNKDAERKDSNWRCGNRVIAVGEDQKIKGVLGRLKARPGLDPSLWCQEKWATRNSHQWRPSSRMKHFSQLNWEHCYSQRGSFDSLRTRKKKEQAVIVCSSWLNFEIWLSKYLPQHLEKCLNRSNLKSHSEEQTFKRLPGSCSLVSWEDKKNLQEIPWAGLKNLAHDLNVNHSLPCLHANI